MLNVVELDENDASRRVFCSRERNGWQSLLVQRMADSPEVEEFVLPPMDAQHLVLVTAGRKTIESGVDGVWRAATYAPGQIGMTAPGRPTRLRWRTMSDEPIQTAHLYLAGETLRRNAQELWGDDVRPVLVDSLAVLDPVLEQTMLGLVRAAESGAPDLYAESAGEFLAVHLLLRHGGRSAPVAPTREDARIRRAVHYMHDQFHRPLTLGEIARKAGLSSFHFLRLFKTTTGRTPLRYLTDIRLAAARQHLAKGISPISEIAHLCGFGSAAHFSTVFSRRVGKSPSAYRKAHRS